MKTVLATIGAKSTAAALRAVEELGLSNEGDRKGAATFGMAFGLAMTCVGAGMTDEQALEMFKQMLRKAR